MRAEPDASAVCGCLMRSGQTNPEREAESKSNTDLGPAFNKQSKLGQHKHANQEMVKWSNNQNSIQGLVKSDAWDNLCVTLQSHCK